MNMVEKVAKAIFEAAAKAAESSDEYCSPEMASAAARAAIEAMREYEASAAMDELVTQAQELKLGY